MSVKYPFIKAISIILKIIWFLQWTFVLAIFITAVLIATNSKLIDLNKITGFHIQFSRIDLQNNDNVSEDVGNTIYLSNGEGRLHLKNDDHKIIYYRLFTALIDSLLYIFIIFILQKIFSSLKTGEFFIRENGIYLKKMAYAVLIIAIVPDFINYLINRYIVSSIVLEGVTLKARFDFEFSTIFLALLIFVIAKVFIRGAELKEENDLTI